MNRNQDETVILCSPDLRSSWGMIGHASPQLSRPLIDWRYYIEWALIWAILAVIVFALAWIGTNATTVSKVVRREATATPQST